MATFYSSNPLNSGPSAGNEGNYGNASSNFYSNPNQATNSSNSNSNPYYTQRQQPSSQGQQPSQQPTEKTIIPNLFNPAAAQTAAALVSGNQDAIFKIGQSQFQKVTTQVQPGVGRFMGMIRVYFAVDNRYVKRKMQRILFSFFFRGWKRQVNIECLS